MARLSVGHGDNHLDCTVCVAMLAAQLSWVQIPPLRMMKSKMNVNPDDPLSETELANLWSICRLALSEADKMLFRRLRFEVLRLRMEIEELKENPPLAPIEFEEEQ